MSEKLEITFAPKIFSSAGYSDLTALWMEPSDYRYGSKLHIVKDRSITELTFKMDELELFAGELHRANDYLTVYKNLTDEEKHNRRFIPSPDRQKSYTPQAIHLKESSYQDPWVWVVPDTHYERVTLHIADHGGGRLTRTVELSQDALKFILAEISRLRDYQKQQGLELYIQALNLAELIDEGLLIRHKNDVLTINPKYDLSKLLELAGTGESDSDDYEPDQDEE